MRKAKSLIFLILALLPCSILLLTIVQGLLSDQLLSLSNFSFGEVTLTALSDGIQIQFTDGSICSSILSSFLSSGQILTPGTAVYSLLSSILILSSSLGFSSIPPVIFIAVFYLIYWVFIYFISALVDLITLIPRLVERAFNL